MAGPPLARQTGNWARPHNSTRAICETIFRQEKAQKRRNPDGFQGFATHSWRKISAKRRSLVLCGAAIKKKNK
jgi:hypothetical protein